MRVILEWQESHSTMKVHFAIDGIVLFQRVKNIVYAEISQSENGGWKLVFSRKVRIEDGN
jgi:hypothetical protein